MDYKYLRVSTKSQSTDAQDKGMNNVICDKTYIDKQTGTNMNRPKLQELLSIVESGDAIHVYDISRLARNVIDVQLILKDLDDKGVRVKFYFMDIDYSTVMGKMIIGIMGSIAEMEAEQISIKVKQGMAVAKKNGKKIGRPATVLSKDFSKAYQLVLRKELTNQLVMNMLDMKKTTYYKMVNLYKEQ